MMEITKEDAKYYRDKFVIESHGGMDGIKKGLQFASVEEESIKRYQQEIAIANGEEFDKRLMTEKQKLAALGNECIMLLAIKKRSEASEKIVKYIEENNYIYTTRDDERSEMWIYDQGIYIPQGHTFINEYVRRILGMAFTKQICNEVIAKIEADTYIESEFFFKHNYKELIPVRNGLLNIFTKELHSFTPSKIFFNKCPVIYNPESTCDVIESFLDDILPSSEDKEVYYEIGGYCLYKEYSYEKAFMFIGNGRNGKGKCLELLKRVVGADNCYSLPLSALQHDNADVSQLFGKMVNLAGDIGFQDLKDTSMFKGLTGRDLVTAKRKYLKAISFENYAKFIFACNELPRVYDFSTGFWDRWILLQFPHYFATKEEWELAPEDIRKNWKIRDENIISKITDDNQLSGLLNKFLEGLERLMSNGKFSSTKSTKEVKEIWIRKSDSFQAFCMDNIVEEYGGRIIKKELRNKFAKYCKEFGLKSVSDRGIKSTLESMYGASEDRYQENPYGVINHVWEGVSWKK